MLTQSLSQLITAAMPHTPTSDQMRAIDALAHFVLTPAPRAAFVLRGYAGTGKTTLVGALVRVLKQLQRPPVLLAPTGRAAKVFSALSGEAAHTIHKVIYRQQSFSGEDTRFSLGFNKWRHTLFIVDEASMIGSGSAGGSLFGSGCLLHDLLHFVCEGEGCRLLFVGDSAQLPPVGEEASVALSADALGAWGVDAGEAELTEVVRQSAASGVLANATRLRALLQDEQDAPAAEALPRLTTSARGEVCYLPGNELVEELESAFADCATDDVVVITRSNKRAGEYNRGIRARIFDRECELARGDKVMAVKNNYYWTEQLAAALPEGEHLPFDFIANGETAEVAAVRNVHEMHGLRFADATLRFSAYGGYELSCRVLLSTLTTDAPALPPDLSQQLYESVLSDYADIPLRRDRMKALRADPYYNALQIKYAYAVTCHKSQGGQWARVFLDQGYLPPDLDRAAYLRWLYTAVTRTTERLYLINWPSAQREGE